MRTTTVTCDECGTEEVKKSKGGSMSSNDESDAFIDVWQYFGKDSAEEDLDLTFCSVPCLIKNMTERIK